MINFKTEKIGEEWFRATVEIDGVIKCKEAWSSSLALQKTLSVFDEEQIDKFLKWYGEKHIYKTVEEHFYADDFHLCAWGTPSALKVFYTDHLGITPELVASRVDDMPGHQNNEKLRRMLQAKIKERIHASLPVLF